jgi:hypothetical protein
MAVRDQRKKIEYGEATMYGYPPPQPQPVYRQEKNYIGQAFIALILYYVGLWVAGLIANIIFLNNAKEDERMGYIVRNKGCLTVLLWVQVIGGILSCIAAIIWLFAMGGLAIISAAGGY